MSDSTPGLMSWLRTLCYAALGVCAGIVVIAFLHDLPEMRKKLSPSFAQEPVLTPAQRATNMANEQLNWAHRESYARLEAHFAPVEEFFRTARTRDFAETCLSWESKWFLLIDKLDGSTKHAQLIEAAFRRCIFDPTELERILAQCTTAYVQEVGSIDGEMLVRLRADLSSLPSGAVPAFDADTLHARYGDALQRAVAASQSDVMATVERETVSFIVSEVMTAALLQVGVSSGILTAGAASGWTTFGAGLVVSVLVDYAVQQYSDPVGKLTADVNARLNGLKTAILNGDQQSPGLIPRLKSFAENRGIARRIAVQELLKGDSVSQASVPEPSF